jgi:predicted enzyme related to lactoylglutathione lyase
MAESTTRTATPTTTTPEFIWADLATADVNRAIAFYRSVLGWQPQALGEEAGGYGLFTSGGRPAAGYGPAPEGQPSAWRPYIGGDAAVLSDAVRSAGGHVVLEPMQVLDAGRMGIFQDPSGAFCGIWEPQSMAGSGGGPGEIGFISWHELQTRDLDAAVRFYTGAFGWDTQESDTGGGSRYVVFTAGEQQLAGAMAMPDMVPEQVPSNWSMYVAVSSIDEAVAAAERSGGKVVMPATETPGVGRWAILADPAGAVFGVLQANAG